MGPQFFLNFSHQNLQSQTPPPMYTEELLISGNQPFASASQNQIPVADFSILGSYPCEERSAAKQTWDQKFVPQEISSYDNGTSLVPFPGKVDSFQQENHTLFGVNIDSPPLLPIINHSAEYQSTFYGADEFSTVLQNAVETDPPRKTFVKVGIWSTGVI